MSRACVIAAAFAWWLLFLAPAVAPAQQEATASSGGEGEAPPKERAPADAADDEPSAASASPLAPGTGLVLAESEFGQVKLGAYALFRAIDQEPASQLMTDHLGNITEIDTRRDLSLHRVLITLSGWLYDPDFSYSLTVWTVNATEQVRVIGALQYELNKGFSLGGGIGALPGTRSLNYSHPYWQGHDRVMADEVFRSGFTMGAWAQGRILSNVDYRVMVANNISTLGVSAAENTRSLAYAGTVAWFPTTGEFGPAGAYGDFEMHDELATRFGFSAVWSPEEDRASQPDQSQPDTTQIRLADSLLLFQTGALAPGATVQKADYQTRAVDAAMKYRGFFLMAEGYYRELKDFVPAAGSAPLPTRPIRDKGFMVQTAFFPIPRTLELYFSTSHVYPQEDMGFRSSHEYILGANWYWSHTRRQRANFQVIDVTRASNGSTFGYYTGGLDGRVYSFEVSMAF